MKARQIVDILNDEKNDDHDLDLDPPCPEASVTLLPTASRPVSLPVRMSFMVTVLSASPLTAVQLEI